MKDWNQRGFSLVELVIALGVLVISLMVVVALLPVGINENKISSDETKASNILTALEADLRNTYPTATFNYTSGTPPLFSSGSSQLFNLILPYAVSSGRVTLNYSLTASSSTMTLSTAFTSRFTTGLNDSSNVVAITTVPPPHFQASVIYTTIPSSGSLTPIGARLIVNWPAISSSTVADLTNISKVRGYVQTYVTFRAP